ncbi:MAG: PilZ domain-containing protein [Desulfobulbaceae bacterium]|nr:PilZ domain-containing protein [Pseudomonadota bacterium]MCG2746698.1 PilZ domain-containing protein [Desulfobulbaceae bacterium]
MADNNSEDYDRRQAVRVMGRNLFYFEPVSQDKFSMILQDFEAGIPPYNQEGLSDIQMFIGAQSALARIKERDSDLADFLAHLDTKVNLLLKKTTASKTIFDKLTLHDLNLSGRGLSFIADRQVAADDILEFHIALLPSYIYVYCFGKVVFCNPLPPNAGEIFYKVGAEFVLIMEDDQEKLIQHNFKQQSLALRNRRLKS